MQNQLAVLISVASNGGIAQLVERLVRNESGADFPNGPDLLSHVHS